MHSSRNFAELSDSQLLELYKDSGNQEVLGVLYERYMALVYGICLKYLKDRDESQDAVMQLFEKLITALQTHQVEHFKSWLYATARNHCLMILRSRKGKRTEELSPFVMENGVTPHPEEGEGMEADLSNLERCIEKLNGEQKQCIQLFYLQQKCYKEITDETGYDFNKVKSYIQNGKRNLKQCMEQHG